MTACLDQFGENVRQRELAGVECTVRERDLMNASSTHALRAKVTVQGSGSMVHVMKLYTYMYTCRPSPQYVN